ncbi:MAG: OmpA family protein [Bacteroidales bacterium]|nr:OmpA family protein [Bacteroidales bacterium]
MNSKHIISIIAAAALATSVGAQQPDDSSNDNNFVGVNLGGGLNTLTYDAANADRKAGGGIETGLFYGYFFNDKYGLGVGLQYSSVSASAIYNYTESTAGLIHPSNPNQRYTLSTKYNDWKERQRMSILSIPVEFLYRRPINDKWSFVGGAGLSLDMHVGGSYKAKEGNYTLSGTFPSLGTYVVSDVPEHGFTTFDGTYDAKIDNRTKVGSSFILDAGARTELKAHWGLYMGLYFGVGFTNLIDESKTTPVVVINESNPTKADYRGTFDSRETDKAHMVRFGVKVAVDFGWFKNTNRVAKPAPAPAVDKDAERLAAEKAAAERAAKEKAEAERLAKEKAEAERLAKEKAEAERLAKEKAEAERLAKEKAAQEQAKVVAEQAKAEAEKLLNDINATVYFGTAGADITLDAETDAAIQAICKAMKADKSLKVVITGFTDNTGSLEINMKYGLKRAEALRDYMVRQGAPIENIECESKGPNNPIADNSTAEGRAKNRRASVNFK